MYLKFGLSYCKKAFYKELNSFVNFTFVKNSSKTLKYTYRSKNITRIMNK